MRVTTAIVAGACLCLLALGLSTAETEASAPSAWEYTLISVRVGRPSMAAKQLPTPGLLAELGAAGWEVCGTVANNDQMMYTLKRPKKK